MKDHLLKEYCSTGYNSDMVIKYKCFGIVYRKFNFDK